MKRLIIWVFLTSLSNLFYAQNISIEELQLNSSPAFVIIGTEAENIQRPNTPTDLLFNLQSSVINDIVQPNLAMELTPALLFRKDKDSTLNKRIDFLLEEDYAKNLWRSITFSLATSPSDTILFNNTKQGTALGVGIHMQLVQGKVKQNKYLKKWYFNKYMHIFLDNYLYEFNIGVKEFTVANHINELDVDNFLKEYPNMPISIKKEIKNRLLSIDKKDYYKNVEILNTKTIKEEKDYLNEVNKEKYPLTKEGFMLEFAFANGSVATSNQWNKLRSAKTAFWLTPSFRLNTNKKDEKNVQYLDFMGVLRYTNNSRRVDVSDYLDAGFKLQYIYNQYSFSGEMIYRNLTKKPDNVDKGHTLRTAFNFNYKISDKITFTTSIGSNFDGNSVTYDQDEKMFAVGGFNFGLNNVFEK